MSTGNPPSKDPADETTLAGTFRAVYAKLLQGVDDMLPAQVIAYDRQNNVATVQPFIAVLTTAGERVPRAQIARVPVLALGGGGFVINFPLKPGDRGWIKANDRDISLYMQSLKDSQPNTYRLHSFQDGLFIPDVVRQFAVDGVSDTEMVIQSVDGNVRVSLSTDTVKIKAPHLIIETTDNTIIGTSTFQDRAIFQDDIEVNGVLYTQHTHKDTEPGTGNSGVPNS